MNIHLAIDEKFLNSFIGYEQKYTNSDNLYIVCTSGKIKHVTKKDNIEFIGFDSIEISTIISKQKKIDKIFFHGIFPFWEIVFEIFNKAHHPTYIWIFYGFEVFELNQEKKKQFKNLTLKYFKSTNQKLFLLENINPIMLRRNIINYLHCTKIKKTHDKKVIEIIKKMDYVAHYIPYDYKNIIQKINSKIKLIDWNYYGTDIMNNYIPKKTTTLKKKNILLGNSDSIFNNHADALNFIQYSVNKDKTPHIIAPLNYNEDKAYIKYICKLGKELFSNDFEPITDFMSKEKYYGMLSKCDAGFFFNLRSQAAGNILWLIKHNIPVFMDTKSSLYDFLKSNGLEIFTIDNIKDYLNEDFVPSLTDGKNQEILENLFGLNAMIKKYKNLLE